MEANRANVTKFEAGKITLASLLRYVFRLNRAELRWIVLSMVILALVSVAAPIFNEQIFSVVIPNADRALMVQIFLMSAFGITTEKICSLKIGAATETSARRIIERTIHRNSARFRRKT